MQLGEMRDCEGEQGTSPAQRGCQNHHKISPDTPPVHLGHLGLP